MLRILANFLRGRQGRIKEGACRDEVVLEALEDRIAPAVIASVQGDTLRIIGDDSGNEIVIRGDESVPGTFILSSSSVEINASMEDLVLAGVKNISIQMGDGEDTIVFDGESPVSLDGWLKVDGGAHVNHIIATNLSVAGDVKLLSNESMRKSGGTEAILTDIQVGGDLVVRYGMIDPVVRLAQSEAGSSRVEGDVMFSGSSVYAWANVSLRDTFVGGDVIAKTKGNLQLSTGDVFGSGSTIGGDLIFRGSGSVNFNTEVLGDVKLSFNGNAEFSSRERAPGTAAVIHGDLTVKTAKAFYDTQWSNTGGGVVITLPGFPSDDSGYLRPQSLTFSVGGSTPDQYAGLEIGGNLSVSGNHGKDRVGLNDLKVGGDTKISLGNGENQTSVRDSNFAGNVDVTCGRDFDVMSTGLNVAYVSEPKINLGKQPNGGGNSGGVFTQTGEVTVG